MVAILLPLSIAQSVPGASDQDRVRQVASHLAEAQALIEKEQFPDAERVWIRRQDLSIPPQVRYSYAKATGV